MGAVGWKRTHGVAAVVFVCIWVLAVPTGWIHSVVFVSHMSMLALVYTAVSAWQSGRTEVKQDESSP